MAGDWQTQVPSFWWCVVQLMATRWSCCFWAFVQPTCSFIWLCALALNNGDIIWFGYGISLRSCKFERREFSKHVRRAHTTTMNPKQALCLCNLCGSNLIKDWCCPGHKQLVKSRKASRLAAGTMVCQAHCLSNICLLTTAKLSELDDRVCVHHVQQWGEQC